ncbi:hypothetical protein SPHI_01940 [Sphingomonas jeddahensis]|uniref:Uncharacterized protein n=1 Tax=Sphingomonas jeddahensis TaxID=1915074 RepID=A0A1V2EZI5_9SPHN|nr:hypothetical protein SPHI_01940 [Sphingomonas jeddahensis]
MMTVLSFAVFAGTFAASAYAIVATVAPRFDRVIGALRGQPQPNAHPLAALVRAEQRIAVRRWAAERRPAPTNRMRAAA